MTDRRSAYDEQLPWLEAVDEEDEPRNVSAGKMLGALLVVLLAAGLVAATFFWLGRQDPADLAGGPELIRAEPGPYKVKPADPGGLDVAGESETAFQTSAGEDTDAQLDLNALPSGPRPAAPQAPTTPGATAPAAREQPAAAAPAPTASSSAAVIQLGAYKNSAQAERAWTALSNRFPSLKSMNKMIVPFSGGIRLRAGVGSAAEAQQACRTIEAGGENCFVAD
jgi:cell division septation protein DedD